MKKFLQDLVRCTSGIDFDVIRVEGTATETKYQSVSNDRSVIMSATTSEPVPDFLGVFGISNPGFLAGLVNAKSYKGDEATVTVTRESRKGKDVPVLFNFDNDAGNTAKFRLMGEEAIPNQPKFAGTVYSVEIKEPTRKKIEEFSEVASLYAVQESKFRPKVDNDDLYFEIGTEHSASHSAKIMFAKGVGSGYTGGFDWPSAQVLTVLKLADNSNSVFGISNDGVLKIEIDTGIATYEFLFPGHN